MLHQALTDIILVLIYKSEFLGFSYGFRPQRSAPNARDAWAVGIPWRRVNGIGERISADSWTRYPGAGSSGFGNPESGISGGSV